MYKLIDHVQTFSSIILVYRRVYCNWHIFGVHQFIVHKLSLNISWLHHKVRLRIYGYCDKFSRTLIKCFSKLGNIMIPSPYDFNPSPPLTMQKRCDKYLRTILATSIDDKNSPVTISTYSISISQYELHLQKINFYNPKSKRSFSK